MAWYCYAAVVCSSTDSRCRHTHTHTNSHTQEVDRWTLKTKVCACACVRGGVCTFWVRRAKLQGVLTWSGWWWWVLSEKTRSSRLS
jgi:hypothetical protein